jgi:hypothetical protein
MRGAANERDSTRLRTSTPIRNTTINENHPPSAERGLRPLNTPRSAVAGFHKILGYIGTLESHITLLTIKDSNTFAALRRRVSPHGEAIPNELQLSGVDLDCLFEDLRGDGTSTICMPRLTSSCSTEP